MKKIRNRALINSILNILYPRHCPICHEILKDQKSLICPVCAGEIKPINSWRCMKCGRPVGETEEYCGECRKGGREFTQGRGIFLYNDKMKASVVRYKYYGCREYGDFYAAAMCRYARDEILRWKPDVIVPVPLHKKKLRTRGFNQSEYLARRVAGFYGIPISVRIIYKTKNTKSQKKLSARERRKNLEEAFSVAERLDGLSVLVIDDVYTTGSTMDAVSAALKEKGAEKIYFLTVCIGRN
ncbi:MAG: ComF family protein [Eubacteriales bacterium]|nr:ComF family protein [Eubacteriales bacterium]